MERGWFLSVRHVVSETKCQEVTPVYRAFPRSLMHKNCLVFTNLFLICMYFREYILVTSFEKMTENYVGSKSW